MKSIVATVLSVATALLFLGIEGGGAAGAGLGERSARRSEGRSAQRRRTRRSTWSTSRAFRARGILRSRGARRFADAAGAVRLRLPGPSLRRLRPQSLRLRPPRRLPRSGPAAWPSRILISRSAATISSWETFTASTRTTSTARSGRGCSRRLSVPAARATCRCYGNLLFMSVEQTSGRVDCGTEGVQEPVSAERFRGVRIFDISDLQQAASDCRHPDVPRIAHAHAR